MGSEFTFYDYIDSDGINVVKAWMASRRPKAKIKLNLIMLYLEATPPGQWSRPYVDTLGGPCTGLIELRTKVDRVQLRLLGFHGPDDREVTLVFGAIEKNERFEPLSACEQALRRKDNVLTDLDRYREEHDYG